MEKLNFRIFLPAFNIRDVAEDLLGELKNLETIIRSEGGRMSALVIDDGSQDRSVEKIEAVASGKDFDFLTLKVNPINVGNTANILYGYEWCLSEEDGLLLVGCCDSDGEHSPLAFVRHINSILREECDGVVGSIIFPQQNIGWVDMQMMRFCGALQADLMGIQNPFYVQSPGFQIHRPEFVRNALANLLPQYKDFFEQENGSSFPRWGMHGVIDTLISISGSKLKSAYLECFGPPPNRDGAKLEMQAQAALTHQATLRKFMDRFIPKV